MALREVLAKFGVDVDTKALDAGFARVEGFKRSIKSTINELRGGFGVETFGISGLVQGLQSEAGAIGAAAKKSGVEVDAFQRLMYQTGKSADDLGGAFRILQRNISLASKGGVDGFQEIDDVLGGELPGSGKRAGELFKSLGLDIKNLNPDNAGESFVTIAERIQQLGTVADRNRAATLAFGPNGPSLVKDAEAMRSLGDEFDRVGGFTQENIDRFKELGRETKRQELGWQKLKLSLAEQFLPVMIAIQKGVTWLVQGFVKAARASSGFEIAAIAIGAAIAVANAGMLRFIARTLLAAAPWIALFLIVDDVVTFFRGGKSILGDFLDVLGQALGLGNIGKEAQKDFQDLVDAFANNGFAETIEEFWANVKRIFKFGFGETWAGFVAWTGQISDTAASWVAKLASVVGQGAVDAGAALIKGFIDGLLGGLPSLLGTVGDVGSAVLSKLGIVSGTERAQIDAFKASINTIGSNLAVDTNRASSVFASGPTARANPGSVFSQANSINITVHGDKDIANKVRDGVGTALNDERRAALAAVESQAR